MITEEDVKKEDTPVQSSEPDQESQQGNELGSKLYDRPIKQLENGRTYSSVMTACAKLKIKPSDLVRALDHHAECNGVHFVYLNDDEAESRILNLEGEIWYDIPGYEGHYQVSNKHRVKSLARESSRWNGSVNGRIRHVPEYIMNSADRIPLHLNGTRRFFTIGQLERMSIPRKHRLFNIDE